MPGKVFISCGQRPPRERRIALRVRKLLRDRFGLDGYLAFKVQSLADIMTITSELRSADYYVLIDFRRDRDGGKQDLPCSLFTHQELALAHHLGFREMIALQENGAPLEGFLQYVLGNPEQFSSEGDLLRKLARLVRERGWNPDYSRNLVVEPPTFVGPIAFGDHTGRFNEFVLQMRVLNRRPDTAAVGAVCILDWIRPEGGKRADVPDRSYLKWAGQMGFERTILPSDFGVLDLFAIHAERPGLFLHSARDTPREPIVNKDGQYELGFKLFSENFPLLEFVVGVKLLWKAPTRKGWQLRTRARLREL